MFSNNDYSKEYELKSKQEEEYYINKKIDDSIFEKYPE